MDLLVNCLSTYLVKFDVNQRVWFNSNNVPGQNALSNFDW